MLQTATKATVDWDSHDNHWHVRIQIGEEVIKRKLDSAERDADADKLRVEATAAAKDEGYEVDPATVTINR
ncbi:MAG TPA: hypothetical protein VIX89_19275 [Bryobacteraceae bacterium]